MLRLLIGPVLLTLLFCVFAVLVARGLWLNTRRPLSDRHQ